MKNIVIIGSSSPLGQNLIEYIDQLKLNIIFIFIREVIKNFDFKKQF